MAELQTVNTPIHTISDGQIIENLDIYVTSGDAITVTNDNVIIRNCRIHHQEGDGISLSGASNVTIQNCEIINASPPTGNGPETSAGILNILAYASPNLTVDHVTLRDGSSGMYLLDSPGATISNVEGFNFHGPFPRGQFVQFDKSGNSTLTNFYVYNDPAHSHVEDNVSVYYSQNVKISNGLIDGNNSPSGVGVMFEGDLGGGKVDHVDAIHMGNGAFSSYSPNVTFDYTRSFDNIATDQGRGLPLSNALIWNASASGIVITHSTYTHPGNPGNIAWDQKNIVDFVWGDGKIKADPSAIPVGDPVTNDFAWDNPPPVDEIPPHNPATTPPADNPTTTPPADNPTTTPPAGNPTTTPPAGNPTTTPPADNPTTTPPADNPTTTPPADNPTTTPPAGNPTTTPPADNPTTTPPADNPTTTPPADNPTTTPPADNLPLDNLVLRGGRGNDHLTGGDGNDQLNGARGNDVLVGHSGNDVIEGGRGQDIVIAGQGNDTINGNSGRDYLLFDGSMQDYTFAITKQGTTITNSAGEADAVKNVEVLHFSDGTNYLIGKHGLVQTSDQTINHFLANSGLDQSHLGPVPTAGAPQQPVQVAASNLGTGATTPVVPQQSASTAHNHLPGVGAEKLLGNTALWNAVDAASNNNPTHADSALADLKQQLHDTFEHSAATDTMDELAALLHLTHHE